MKSKDKILALEESKKRRMEEYLAENLKSQKRKKQVARKVTKTPVSKRKQPKISVDEPTKSSEKEKEQIVSEVIFSPPIIPVEEQKKIRLEAKHRKEMKSFLLSKGFNGKRFRRMSTDIMEKHVNDFKEKESMKGKDTKFVKDFE